MVRSPDGAIQWEGCPRRGTALPARARARPDPGSTMVGESASHGRVGTESRSAPGWKPGPRGRAARPAGREGSSRQGRDSPSRPALLRSVGSFEWAPSFDIRSSTSHRVPDEAPGRSRDILRFRRGTGAPAPVPLPPEPSVGPGKIPRHLEDPRGTGGGPPVPRESRPTSHDLSDVASSRSRIAQPTSAPPPPPSSGWTLRSGLLVHAVLAPRRERRIRPHGLSPSALVSNTLVPIPSSPNR